jgi:hypothetical protein
MGLMDVSKMKVGSTAFGPVATVVSTDLPDWPGVEKWFTDENPSTGSRRSNRAVLRRLVRNSSGVNLKPKRLCRFKVGTMGAEVDGYTHVPSQGSYIVLDEFLPTAGVRTGDICWGVIRGPATVITSELADAGNLITQGAQVVAATGATSQADSSAGRVAIQTFNASTAVDQSTNLNSAVNAVGRAMSAKTTANSDADLLVDVDYHR